MNAKKLRNYARLIAVMGADVRPGQTVWIDASLDQPEFVTMLAKECYALGAERVTVNWNYLPMTKLNQEECSVGTLSRVETWERSKLRWQTGHLPVRIYLESDDPDGLCGVDQNKISRASQARYRVIKPFRDAMENKYQWCIAAVPGVAWAKKVFPDLPPRAAVERLWEAILATSRADGEDPILAWKEHNEDLSARCAYLNSLGVRSLEYKSANGTDFRVGLLPDALFMGGAETAMGSGIVYNPNIPSEEVFTSPRAGDAEGVVVASRPLSYRGELIEDFSFRFEGGKVVEYHAARGEALLGEMVKMDAGAAMLGECALVPYHSPIRNSGILFYNTLFDENAACHLALGMGFTNVLKDYERYTTQECYARGINDSMIHVDFMIGTEDLSITALCEDGRRVPIFAAGDWAF